MQLLSFSLYRLVPFHVLSLSLSRYLMCFDFVCLRVRYVVVDVVRQIKEATAPVRTSCLSFFGVFTVYCLVYIYINKSCLVWLDGGEQNKVQQAVKSESQKRTDDWCFVGWLVVVVVVVLVEEVWVLVLVLVDVDVRGANLWAKKSCCCC